MFLCRKSGIRHFPRESNGGLLLLNCCVFIVMCKISKCFLPVVTRQTVIYIQASKLCELPLKQHQIYLTQSGNLIVKMTIGALLSMINWSSHTHRFSLLSRNGLGQKDMIRKPLIIVVSVRLKDHRILSWEVEFVPLGEVEYTGPIISRIQKNDRTSHCDIDIF